MSFGRNPSGSQVKDEATHNAFAIIERDMVEIDRRLRSLEKFRSSLANEIDRSVDSIDEAQGTASLVTVLRGISLNIKKL